MFSKFISTALKIKYTVLQKTPSINIFAALADAKNILVYMPEKIDQFGAALKALERLRKIRPDWKIHVITKLEMVSFFDKRFKFEVLPYSKNDLNFWGLPKNSFKKLFQNTTFDLALDLHLDMDVLSVALFQLSGAPLKVCFDNTAKSPFYNLGIRINQAETLKNKYNAMIKYITLNPEPRKAEPTPKKA